MAAELAVWPPPGGTVPVVSADVVAGVPAEEAPAAAAPGIGVLAGAPMVGCASPSVSMAGPFAAGETGSEGVAEAIGAGRA
ncbi:hypothetical protein, partial [Mesorhizobium sp.]|uniref:hypothetical protein n=1 Tax=Mesorhizobium sp. TaxID=1871066 RepID=UPI00344CF436